MPQALYEVKSDLSAQTAAYASIRSPVPEAEDALQNDSGKKAETLSFSVEKQAVVLPESVLEDGSALDAGVYEVSRGYSYQISKAVAYGDRYWKHYNHSYHNYANEGGDCANFVSQCLYAGGMPRTDDWFPQSVNWINVMGHIRHFKAYGSFLTASNSNVSAGNPVYYDWNRDGIYDHTTLCVGVNSSGMPVVDSHTANLYHAPWSMGSHAKRGTIRLHGTGASSSSAPKKNSWETVGGKTYYIGSDGKESKINSSGSTAELLFQFQRRTGYRLLQGWLLLALCFCQDREAAHRIPVDRGEDLLFLCQELCASDRQAVDRRLYLLF